MIRQCFILFGCLALGELIVYLTGIKLPSSIIGMLLLTLFLKLKWVKLHWVQGLSDFLVANLGFFFVPIVVSTVISTILVLVSTGWVHQYIRRHARFSKHENSSNRSKAQDDGLSKQ